jgi:predicted acyltransferase
MKAIPERYPALDVLRGMTVAFMIIVNTPGSWNDIYAPLQHSAWHGCTVTDLVFPSFLFVVGNALSFSRKKMALLSSAAMLRKAATRGLLIFLIGWLLNAFPFVSYKDGSYIWKDITAIRLWGVLQRIAVCYFFAVCLVYYCNRRTLLLLSAMVLLSYWGVLYYGGIPGEVYTLTGNIAGKVELSYLPVKNIYTHYPIPFEPLGLLSTFPAIINVIIGYLTGDFLQQPIPRKEAVKRLSLIGVAMTVLGLAWDQLFPINKALWTSSYVVYTSGIVILFLCLLIIVIDIAAIKRWSYFFEVFGKNPLFIYILSWVVAVLLGIIHINGPSFKGLVYSRLFTSWLSPVNASLLFALCYMLLMWLVGFWMDKRKIYVKV